jgi:uncharacterized membrane protein
MYASIVALKIRLAYKWPSAIRIWTDMFFLAVCLMGQHMLLVVVSPSEALVFADLADVLCVGRIGVSPVVAAFPRHTSSREVGTRL